MDWSNLRSWHGSKEMAFEELCCQLAASEAVPAGSRFFRKGTPDSGVECYWVFPDGTEWGWQAKFFLESLDSSQWKQLDESVATAITGHPKLVRYVVCLPRNFAEGRKPSETSEKLKWDDRVTRWKDLAAKHGLTIEFEFWGDFQLNSRLSSEAHRGRLWFWFNQESLSDLWFKRRVEEAVSAARDRYDRNLNVEVAVHDTLDALARNPRFEERLRSAFAAFAKQQHTFRNSGVLTDVQAEFDEVCRAAEQLSGCLAGAIASEATSNEWRLTAVIPIDAAIDFSSHLSDLTDRYASALWKLQSETEPQSSNRSSTVASHALWELRRFEESIPPLTSLLRSDDVRIANAPSMLLTGKAGQGKTHLLCDFAKCETEAGRPCLLFHGEQFHDGEPWSQMIELLGLNCSVDEFLGALEAAAQARNMRVLILIDALNEGPGNRLWCSCLPPMLTRIQRLPWLGICVSVRSIYEDWIVPHPIESLTRVTHDGFAGNGWRAVEAFFAHFGIEPSTPMLDPEFDNPLFLKLFCHAITKRGLRRVPDGMRGITSVFEHLIDAIDNKLSRPEHLNYDRRERLVRKAVDALAEAMANQRVDHLPLDQAKALVNSHRPPNDFGRTLFSNLESEGLISAIPNYDFEALQDSPLSESVRFTFQRFSDHLIAERLLDRHVDRTAPRACFEREQPLGQLFESKSAAWQNAGLLEALAVQLPERLDVELHDVLPHLVDSDLLNQAVLNSLIWRHHDSFSDSTFAIIERDLRFRDEYWLAVLNLATVPNHPLNADYLCRELKSYDMADRDARWSIFLHQQWQSEEHGPIHRLVDWAWAENDKSKFSDEVIRLAGVTLAWFFATSNRFLRDRATKALVRLCENRLSVIRQIIRELHDVDDLYVTERLLAVAYGCAMRTQDRDGLRQLAADVFALVFQTGHPPVHLLLRDYARGVIDCAIARGCVLDIDMSRVRPPYGTTWPADGDIPTDDEIKQYASWPFFGSVTNKYEDFRNYIMQRLDSWTLLPVGSLPPQTVGERVEEFVALLTDKQHQKWELLESLSDSFKRYLPRSRKIGALAQRELETSQDKDDEEQAIAQAEAKFRRSLRAGSQKRTFYDEVVRPYRENPYRFNRGPRVDVNAIARWMVQRIVDMGWTPERFREFDEGLPYRGRTAHEVERMSKKYQWLALREAQARLGDTFQLKDSREGIQLYEGAWQVSRGRDIDPSNLLVSTLNEEWETHSTTWWSPLRFDKWFEPIEELSWIKDDSGMPDPRGLISVQKPDDGNEWLTLSGFYQWQQPLPLGTPTENTRRREFHYSVQAYFVDRKNAQRLFTWGTKQNWWNRWMPEPNGSHDIALGEFFWSTEFKVQECEYYGREGWTRGDSEIIPVEILVATDEYSREKSGFDYSIDESLLIDLPCAYLVREMGLDWHGREGEWFDARGNLIAFDPSVRKKGPRALLINQVALDDFLKSRDLAVFWTVSGERDVTGGDLSHENYQGHLIANGAYLRVDGELKGSTRFRFIARGDDEHG